MSPWWPSQGLPSQCPIFQASQCNSFEDGAPADFIYSAFLIHRVFHIEIMACNILFYFWGNYVNINPVAILSQLHFTKQKGMLPWWQLSFSWFPILKSSHCNSFKDQVPMSWICWRSIFLMKTNWVQNYIHNKVQWLTCNQMVSMKMGYIQRNIWRNSMKINMILLEKRNATASCNSTNISKSKHFANKCHLVDIDIGCYPGTLSYGQVSALIWRAHTSRWNLWVSALPMSCSDLT